MFVRGEEHMTNGTAARLKLLRVHRPLSEKENHALADACRKILSKYHKTVAFLDPSTKLTALARRAYLYLGGDPEQSSASLKDYDQAFYGPFVGVSDEGSAAGEIRDAALESPKILALPKSTRRTSLIVGVAVDAERLGGIGELAVGPEEYADIWLASVDRVLITTNVGTRVNLRVYRREPVIILRGDSSEDLKRAKAEIAAAFRPFVETPDRQPRALTVLVDIPRFVQISTSRRISALSALAVFVKSGQAVGMRRAPKGHALGLLAWVGRGIAGRDASITAIKVASGAGLKLVVLDGVKRKAADQAISLAGLLDYFEPGIVGPLLRKAKQENVELRAANLPDTDTIARSVWVGLNTARSMGANLGKYGCFPLTLPEIDYVVQQEQRWLPRWSAAPVFFVDQGLLREGAVDVERDLPRGIEIWLNTVAAHGVGVVLIDTIEKASGRRLLKRNPSDNKGYLGWRQIQRIEKHARNLKIRVLWAGGLGLRDAYEMGKLGVFGIYVTSATATTIPVHGSYVRDPALAGAKKPTKEGVLRTKILLEAGFLTSKLQSASGQDIGRVADTLLSALDRGDAANITAHTITLASKCTAGWRVYWRTRSRE
jgi:hypothetical protein